MARRAPIPTGQGLLGSVCATSEGTPEIWRAGRIRAVQNQGAPLKPQFPSMFITFATDGEEKTLTETRRDKQGEESCQRRSKYPSSKGGCRLAITLGDCFWGFRPWLIRLALCCRCSGKGCVKNLEKKIQGAAETSSPLQSGE